MRVDLMRWTKLPDSGLEVRETAEGAFWRYDPPHILQTEEGQGPYASSLDDAAREGAEYASWFVGGGSVR